MRFTLSIKLFLILTFSQSISAAITGAPTAPDQPVVVQDGLLAKISWTSQTANTEAFISQSVNGSVWTNDVKVPFQHYDAPIELGKSYSYKVKVCNVDGVIIDPPPVDTFSLISPSATRTLSGNSLTTSQASTLSGSTSPVCSEWSYPSIVINVPALQVQSPVISPRNLEITDATTVTLNPIGSGVIVRYALNSNEINENSPIFPTSLTINSSMTISLKAFKPGYANSNVVTYFFTKLAISTSTMKFKYDALGRLIVVEDGSGNSVEYVLDNAGNRIQVK